MTELNEAQKLIQDIRTQKSVQTEQALSLIEIAKVSDSEESKNSFLSMAQKQLGDEKVLNAWLDMATQLDPQVWENLIHKMLISVLQVLQGKFSANAYEILKPYLQIIATLLKWPDLKEIASTILFHASRFDESVLGPVEEVFMKSSSGDLKRFIAEKFLKILPQYAPSTAFFKTHFSELDQDIQSAAVSELILLKKLSTAEQMTLAQQGNDVVKYLFIDSWGRSLSSLSAEQVSLMESIARKSGDWRLRLAVAAVFKTKSLASDDFRKKILDLFKEETKSEVKTLYVELMSDWICDHPEVRSFLATVVLNENEPGIVDRLVLYLAPYLGSPDATGISLRMSWLELLTIRTDSAFLFERSRELAEVIQANSALIPELTRFYTQVQNEQTQASILNILKNCISFSSEVRNLFEGAFSSRSKLVRESVLSASLMLAMDAETKDFLLRAALSFSLDTDLNESQRQKIVKKIILWPAWTAEEARSVSELSLKIPAHWEVQKWLGKAQMASASKGPIQQSHWDWDGIRARWVSSQSSENLIPQFYFEYGNAADGAQTQAMVSLIKEMILSSTYLKRHNADSKEALLQFLDARNEIDPSLARHLVSMVLLYQNTALIPFYLSILKRSSCKLELKDSVWDLFSKVLSKGNSTEMMLVYEILLSQFSEETDSIEFVRQRIHQEVQKYEGLQGLAKEKFLSAISAKKDSQSKLMPNTNHNEAGFLDD